ncbi:MAG: 3-hydroxyacyl-CoA dehydrogenase/enoyl-CoA hydratase/3-hydroxybutyryl-CoA epimerase [Porticoccaceae bacterium]|jgi:3-hydroxyacyl-CoA dehydrogenase/enoyl-CoA hydratase/3-hydroxybutyryl-CoA epimerase/enoyl-CoA isomerase
MFEGKTLSLTTLDNDYAEIKFDSQSGSVNKFNAETLAELRQAMDILKQQQGIKGLLLSSGKSVFVVGADITEFKGMFSASKEQFVEAAYVVNALFSEIEDLPYPSVAAINGFALGGGFEVCLACDCRVISSKAAVGLPETGLGIIPGWGGTVRLPRLIGYADAVQWIVSGQQQKPAAAQQAGAVDVIAEPEELRTESLKVLQEMVDGTRDYEARRLQKTSPLTLSGAELEAAASNYRAAVVGKLGSHYPAQLKAIDLVAGAASLGRDEAVRRENVAFYEISQTAQARALVGLFLNEQYVVKLAKNRAVAHKPEPIKTAGVIGAGIMGGGIAYQNAIRGYSVVMKDIAQPALDLGIDEATKLLSKSVSRGKLTEDKAQQLLSSISPTLVDSDINGCEILVEAVVELEVVKMQVLAAAEALLPTTSIMTSNTSTISINRLAEPLQRPENFCGMHFFNPVHAMPLVEIIRGEHTSDATVAAVCTYALGLGKKPIVVNDCPGFLVNRVLFAMLFGLEIMISEGADFQQIDKVMEGWGLPMGPAYLMDVIGIDTINHCYPVMMDGLPQRFKKTADLWPTEAVFNATRLGQKNGLGYYRYELNEKGKPAKAVDPEVIAMLESLYGAAKQLEADEIIDRLMVAMAMEMIHCLEEGVVASPAEADMALIYGVGFPPFHGGICRWMDEIGLQEICDRGDRYLSISELYRPTEKLRAMAAKGETLYS